jgi:putative peptide zinc metalloprotease protein
MVTLQDSLVSSTARKLSLRARPDLVAKEQRYQNRAFWVIKDPVGLQYFRFQEEEYFILSRLDGNTSLDTIKEEFELRFPPQKITVEEIQSFLGMLHKSGLILADVPHQGHELRRRGDQRRRKELAAKWSNFLSLRFKGFDPDRFLTWLDGKIGWVYSPVCVFCCMALALAALLLVAAKFEEFQAKLPAFHSFFNAKNAFILAGVMGVTKIIHEIGHGLTCKHYGGECHEMGVMLLVLTPCLYCNVSDSWMLPNKWHRVAIGAAGMYIEIVMASVCTFVWWFSSDDSLIHNICFSTMFVSSVSTLVFNGNPLLRYDGYYILSDILEIPNLQQKSTEIMSRKASQWFLGMEQPENSFLPQQHQALFAIYSVASVCYRWFVVLSILVFFDKFWKPYRLEIIGQMLGLLAMYGMFVAPIWKVVKFFIVPGRIYQVKKPRFYATLGVAAVLILVFTAVPLPYRVVCTLEIQPYNAKSLYVRVPGVLEEVYVKPGDIVKAGQPLAQLRNDELRLEIEKLKQEKAKFETQLTNFLFEQYENPKVKGQIPEVEKSLAATKEELGHKQKDLDDLTLRAPASGTILPPVEMADQPSSAGRLKTWYGSPLVKRNLGCTLQQSSLFCRVGNPHEMEAILIIEQADFVFIDKGQEVDVNLQELPGESFHGVVTEIASGRDLESIPKSLQSKYKGDVATKADPTGVERPLTPVYQARVPLEDPEGLLSIGLTGNAKVHAGWQTLAKRTWRFVARTFNFR